MVSNPDQDVATSVCSPPAARAMAFDFVSPACYIFLSYLSDLPNLIMLLVGYGSVYPSWISNFKMRTNYSINLLWWSSWTEPPFGIQVYMHKIGDFFVFSCDETNKTCLCFISFKLMALVFLSFPTEFVCSRRDMKAAADAMKLIGGFNDEMMVEPTLCLDLV